jgi:hypothetical protein
MRSRWTTPTTSGPAGLGDIAEPANATKVAKELGAFGHCGVLMSEWRLFPEGTVPDFTTPGFFERHPWVPPGHQRGHAERMEMVAELIGELHEREPIGSVTDLGSGDGSLLVALQPLGIPSWGYDAGLGNVSVAAAHGVDVRCGDILAGGLEYGSLIVASEVVEHLLDPHGFVAGLPGRRLVLSSPSAENADWHYEHHAWAWDMSGYRRLVEGAGWTVVDHRECRAEPNFHCDQWRPQRFQAIAAVR